MIYEIYIKCHDDRYTPAIYNDFTNREEKHTFRGKSKDLQPYRVPEYHYDIKRLTHSLHHLNFQVKCM